MKFQTGWIIAFIVGVIAVVLYFILQPSNKCTSGACASAPCQNGGTCQNNNGVCTCFCINGYTGSNCQTSSSFIPSDSIGVAMLLNYSDRNGPSIMFFASSLEDIQTVTSTLTLTRNATPYNFSNLGTYYAPNNLYNNSTYKYGWTNWFYLNSTFSIKTGDIINIVSKVTSKTGAIQNLNINFVVKQVGNNVSLYGWFQS